MGLQLRNRQNHTRHAQQHHLRHVPNLRRLLHHHGNLHGLLVSLPSYSSRQL